jgi:hypothetical protein
MAVELTPADVAQEIRTFLAGSAGDWDWDDFLSIRIKDPRLDAIRRRCNSIPDEYPPIGKGYCNEAGRAVLAELADEAERLAPRE